MNDGELPPYRDPGLDVEARLDDLLPRMTLEEKVNEMNLVVDLHFDPLLGGMTIEDVIAMLRNWGVTDPEERLRGGTFDSPGGSVWGQDGTFLEEACRSAFVSCGRAHAWGMATSPEPRVMAEIANRIHRMVAEETRLGIPPLLSAEGLHGHLARGATMFPLPIGMASTWDEGLIEEVGAATAAEARAVGVANLWHPVLDLARDPRWGRTGETYGEDRYLAARLGVAMVRGLQGDDVSTSDRVAATLKHFAGHGAPLGGRDSNMAGVGEREMRELHLVPFQAAVLEAGALSVMPAYHAIDGVPCHADSWLLGQVLRTEWGLPGFTVSDAGAVEHLHEKHRVAADQQHAVKLAVEAGLDVHNNGGEFREPLLEMVREGVIAEALVDQAARRVLRVKMRLGLFDDPYVDPERAATIVGCDEHRALARRAARESLVLLKNEAGLLPIADGTSSVLVVGPNADHSLNQLGGYSFPCPAVTVLEGIRARAGGDVEVTHRTGCGIWDGSDEEIAEAVAVARRCDLVVAVMGDSSAWGRSASCGEGVDRAVLDLPGRQQELLEALHATGAPVVLVLVTARPATIPWAAEKLPAILEAWCPGCEGGHAVAEALFGDLSPGGKLPITVPRHSGQLPLTYDQKPSGRHIRYVDTGAEPLYPFGFGLGYTEFSYSGLEIAPARIAPGEEVVVGFEVTNVGAVAGDEVVQLYLDDVVSSVVTPMRALKGFRRIHLAPGERRRVELTLTPAHMQLLDRDLRPVVEPGGFEVMVGASSADIRLHGSFEVVDSSR